MVKKLTKKAKRLRVSARNPKSEASKHSLQLKKNNQKKENDNPPEIRPNSPSRSESKKIRVNFLNPRHPRSNLTNLNSYYNFLSQHPNFLMVKKLTKKAKRLRVSARNPKSEASKQSLQLKKNNQKKENDNPPEIRPNPPSRSESNKIRVNFLNPRHPRSNLTNLNSYYNFLSQHPNFLMVKKLTKKAKRLRVSARNPKSEASKQSLQLKKNNQKKENDNPAEIRPNPPSRSESNKIRVNFLNPRHPRSNLTNLNSYYNFLSQHPTIAPLPH